VKFIAQHNAHLTLTSKVARESLPINFWFPIYYWIR